MKNILLSLLFITILASFAGATDHYHFTPIYNTNKAELIKRLSTAKTNTEKYNLLSSLFFYDALVESPADLDTIYLNRLINLNQSVGLIDDKPYLTLRSALRLGAEKKFKEELALLKTAVDQFDEQNTDISTLLIGMRYLFNINNDQEDRLHYYSQKLSYYLAKGQYHNAAACYHCIAGYYSFKGDINSAISYYLKASELFKSFSNLWYTHEIGVVASAYNEWGNNAKSIFYVQMALKLENGLDVRADKINLISTFASLEYNAGNYQLALDYLNRLSPADYSQSKHYVSANISVKSLKVMAYVALHRLPDAYRLVQELQKLPPMSGLERISLNNGNTVEYAYYKYYLAIKDLPKAEKFLLASYQVSDKNGDAKFRVTYLKELAKFYGSMDNTVKAWQYSRLYYGANDSLQNRRSSFNIASYENEQIENAQNKKLIALQQQHAVQEATISQRNTIIWVSLIGLLGVLGSLVFIYRQLHINKRTLKNLKTTQTQLIQSEKMASLGELTAGIAHEIQNPLNFVNNFSEVSVELLTELKEEAEAGHTEDVIEIADSLTQNLEKITHHGKRADAIVKGMLQHSQTGSGAKELININALADEYMRLAYHGLRAKDKSFNADLVTNYDEHLPKINAIPQDIGRVLLNLFNNAFYAVNQKMKTAGADYKPEVSVETFFLPLQGVGGLKVRDNGNGIPDAIKDKIMQPFFTTKPTGEGTGLGLSLSYDIIVKGHGGSINVATEENEYAEFTVMLPINL